MKTQSRIEQAEEQLAEHPRKSEGLPPDPEEMNDSRAEWAENAIQGFMEETGVDLPDATSDLLDDIMHFCDRMGFDFEAELARARNHYQEETSVDTGE